MKIKLLHLVTLNLLLMISLVFSQGSPRYYWYHYVVDTEGPIGGCTSLSFDRQGLPHIAYRGMDKVNGYRVNYAAYDGSNWNITVINGFPKGEPRVVMALDTSDYAHILYHTIDGEILTHSYYNGLSWITNDFDTELIESLYYWVSISVDENNIVKMAYAAGYENRSRNRMSYNTFDGNEYSGRELIDSSGYWSGKWNSLTLDSQGNPAVAYWLETEDLIFGKLDQGVWKTEGIDSTGYGNYQGYFPTVQFGTDQNYYISFYSQSMKKIRLAKGNFGNWELEEVVDYEGWRPWAITMPMLLDTLNNPLIAFYDLQEEDLKITYKMNDVWKVENVDTGKKCGLFASMAFNSEGLPAISYFDEENGYLKYAVASFTPPPDYDGDGLPDYLEEILGTSIVDLDTDDDGLSDSEEDANRNGVVDISETSPINIDTDDDSLQDGLELGRTSGIFANPPLLGTDMAIFKRDLDPSTTTNPLEFDTDKDSLSDGQEDANKNGREDFNETDPNNFDTDGDNILDGLEVMAGLFPLDVDTDDDGLSDSEEDVNLNGIWDVGETSPALYDSDFDSLSDGLEISVTLPIPDPDGSGKLLGTAIAKFRGDVDTTTQTNPLLSDTDQDSLIDGHEDLNINGRFDSQESDPLNPDTDGDLLKDGIERLAGSDPTDLDTDDDGIRDNIEDKNLNGIVDPDETSSIIFDTDNDMVSDGVEIGIVSGVPDPDGQGILQGTDTTVFISDKNTGVNSLPLIWDTDEDGLADGEEDVNGNGAVDVGETHFLLWDTDNDTLSDGDEVSFNSDPLDPENVASVDTLHQHKFHSPPIPPKWTIVDEGENDAPSNWFIWDEALAQGSNIFGGDINTGGEDPDKPGTYMWLSNFYGEDYKIKFDTRSQNIGSLGIMFYYTDEDNYYRLSMNREKNYRRITKKYQGQSSVLVLQDFTYEQNRYYEIIVFIVSGRIQVYFDKVRIFDIQDASLTGGSIGFYSWKNPMSMFRNLSIFGKYGVTGIYNSNTTNIYAFSVGNTNGKGILTWRIHNNPGISLIELYRREQERFVSLEHIQVQRSESPYIEGGYVDSKPWLADSYKLVLYDFNHEVIEEKVIASSRVSISDFSLTDPFPNPSKGKLNMVFQSPEHVLLRFKIYDILGRMVREFETTQHPKSWKQVAWDGKDAHGQLVSKGIYIIQIQALSVNSPGSVLWQEVKKVARIR